MMHSLVRTRYSVGVCGAPPPRSILRVTHQNRNRRPRPQPIIMHAQARLNRGMQGRRGRNECPGVIYMSRTGYSPFTHDTIHYTMAPQVPQRFRSVSPRIPFRPRWPLLKATRRPLNNWPFHTLHADSYSPAGLVSGADRDDNVVSILISDTSSCFTSGTGYPFDLVNNGGHYQPVGHFAHLPRSGALLRLPRRYIIGLTRARG